MSVDLETRIRARSIVTRRVDAMIHILKARHPAQMEELRFSSIPTMKRWSEVEILQMERSFSGTGCNLAGVYLDSFKPPRIGISSNSTQRRASFTALHEYGHHLQQTDDALIDQLAAQPDYGRVLEEMSSDAFAATVLLPDEWVMAELGTGTPTAPQIVALWISNAASRAAVCVAASKRLDTPGHVLLLDEAGLVVFSASHGEFPLRAGSDQSETAIFKALQSQISQDTPVRAITRFSYKPPWSGPELYAQAANMGGYWVVVAVTHTAPWERISLSSAASPVVAGAAWRTCERCEWVYKQVGQRCELCGVQKCPECDACDCPSGLRERTCDECFLIRSAEQFDGDSSTCRECLS
jgi:Zn-dependent peptidase ImmA (M78 family)